MKFRYQAKTQKGEPQVGFVEATDKETAMNILASHELFVLSIEQVGKERWYHRVLAYFGRVRGKDLVVFTRQFAILLGARLPLGDVLRTLHQQTDHLVLKEAIFRISEDVDSGLSFSQALERQSAIFSDFFVSMIRSAELTGNLDRVAGFLADYFEKEAVLAAKARAALIYPTILIGLFLVVVFIMLTVVFPQIGPVFEQSGVALPWFTRFLIASGTFAAEWWIVLTVFFAVLVVIALDYFQTEEGRALRDDLVVRLPLIKKVYLPLTLTRLSNTMEMLLRGRIPMAQAVQIVGQTIGNTLYRDLLEEIADQVRQGVRLAEAIEQHPAYLPPLVARMVAVGEATGQVDQMFKRIGDFYSREADEMVGNLVDLIQPVLIIGIGLLVAILFASILLPLYQLTATIG